MGQVEHRAHRMARGGRKPTGIGGTIEPRLVRFRNPDHGLHLLPQHGIGRARRSRQKIDDRSDGGGQQRIEKGLLVRMAAI